jgi:hypothetical protein
MAMFALTSLSAFALLLLVAVGVTGGAALLRTRVCAGSIGPSIFPKALDLSVVWFGLTAAALWTAPGAWLRRAARVFATLLLVAGLLSVLDTGDKVLQIMQSQTGGRS